LIYNKKMKTVAKIQVEQSLRASITKVIDELGGIERFVARNDTVLIKPNFNTADPPPASTDPEFLRTFLEIITDCGTKKIIIGESSTFRLRARNVMQELGIYQFQKQFSNLEIIDFNDQQWAKKKVPNADYLKKVSIPKILDHVDKLILLPCCKTHFIAKFTGSLKLAVGFMRPRERLIFHLRNVQEKIAELNRVIHPDLIIMDARKVFISAGPSKGELREPDVILAGTDRVAVDKKGIEIIKEFNGNSLSEIKNFPQLER
jgi:uncharacterized protein (DUF362 family)